MTLVNDLIQTNLQNFGIEPFGISMPVISKKWIDSSSAAVTGNITLTDADLSLASTSNWLAPIAGRVRKVGITATLKAPVSLFKTDGSAINEEGLLLIVNPQSY